MDWTETARTSCRTHLILLETGFTYIGAVTLLLPEQAARPETQAVLRSALAFPAFINASLGWATALHELQSEREQRSELLQQSRNSGVQEMTLEEEVIQEKSEGFFEGKRGIGIVGRLRKSDRGGRTLSLPKRNESPITMR
jgi:hypothetical protein